MVQNTYRGLVKILSRRIEQPALHAVRFAAAGRQVRRPPIPYIEVGTLQAGPNTKPRRARSAEDQLFYCIDAAAFLDAGDSATGSCNRRSCVFADLARRGFVFGRLVVSDSPCYRNA